VKLPFAVVIILLTIIPAIFAYTAIADTQKELTIPINQRFQLNNNLTVNIIQVTISNQTYGSAYSANPENMVWPVLLFQYTNNGDYPAAGRLHVKFVDNRSVVYDKVDMGNVEPIYPGKTYAPAFVEVAMPRDRILEKVIIVDGQNETMIPITYPDSYLSPTPEPYIDSSDTINIIIYLLIGLTLVVLTVLSFYVLYQLRK
jgi:hypothetical protein